MFYTLGWGIYYSLSLKLVTPLGLRVEYVYVLNDWFRKKEYKDVLDYIQSVNCHYKFNELPLSWLGLPVPHTTEQKSN